MYDRRRLLVRALIVTLAPSLGPAAAFASEKKEGEGPAAGPLIDLPTLTATVRRPDGRRGVLTVQASLNAPAPAVAQKAVLLRPRLMDAYVTALQGMAATLVPGVPPDLDVLTRVLQRETDRVIGKGAAVLLGGVMIS